MISRRRRSNNVANGVSTKKRDVNDLLNSLDLYGTVQLPSAEVVSMSGGSQGVDMLGRPVQIPASGPDLDILLSGQQRLLEELYPKGWAGETDEEYDARRRQQLDFTRRQYMGELTPDETYMSDYYRQYGSLTASGTATPVYPMTYVSPSGDLEAILSSIGQVAEGNYVSGLLNGGLALGSIFLPGSVQVGSSKAGGVFEKVLDKQGQISKNNVLAIAGKEGVNKGEAAVLNKVASRMGDKMDYMEFKQAVSDELSFAVQRSNEHAWYGVDNLISNQTPISGVMNANPQFGSILVTSPQTGVQMRLHELTGDTFELRDRLAIDAIQKRAMSSMRDFDDLIESRVFRSTGGSNGHNIRTYGIEVNRNIKSINDHSGSIKSDGKIDSTIFYTSNPRFQDSFTRSTFPFDQDDIAYGTEGVQEIVRGRIDDINSLISVEEHFRSHLMNNAKGSKAEIQDDLIRTDQVLERMKNSLNEYTSLLDNLEAVKRGDMTVEEFTLQTGYGFGDALNDSKAAEKLATWMNIKANSDPNSIHYKDMEFLEDAFAQPNVPQELKDAYGETKEASYSGDDKYSPFLKSDARTNLLMDTSGNFPTSRKHFDEAPAGHVRSFESPKDPSALFISELQSDALQAYNPPTVFSTSSSAKDSPSEFLSDLFSQAKGVVTNNDIYGSEYDPITRSVINYLFELDESEILPAVVSLKQNMRNYGDGSTGLMSLVRDIGFPESVGQTQVKDILDDMDIVLSRFLNYTEQELKDAKARLYTDPASTAISKSAQKTQYKRLVQESTKIAAEKGKKKVYFPTGETVYKVESWQHIHQDKAKALMRNYDNLDKDIKKGLGVKAKKVEVGGSTWWEVDIPESYLSGTQEIIAFGLGGKMRVKKRQQ